MYYIYYFKLITSYSKTRRRYIPKVLLSSQSRFLTTLNTKFLQYLAKSSSICSLTQNARNVIFLQYDAGKVLLIFQTNT